METSLGPPKVITKDELIYLNPNGRVCEICDQNMHDHEWVVLDHSGFAIFCSNLIHWGTDIPEVFTESTYDEETDVDCWGPNRNIERALAHANLWAEKEMSQENPPDKIEVYARKRVIFMSAKTNVRVIK